MNEERFGSNRRRHKDLPTRIPSTELPPIWLRSARSYSFEDSVRAGWKVIVGFASYRSSGGGGNEKEAVAKVAAAHVPHRVVNTEATGRTAFVTVTNEEASLLDTMLSGMGFRKGRARNFLRESLYAGSGNRKKKQKSAF